MVNMTGGSPWVVLIPVKNLDSAKSRLAELNDGNFNGKPSSELALAFARDVITAAANAATPSTVLVVGSDPEVLDASMGPTTLFLPESTEPEPTGLNAALQHAISHLRQRNAAANVIVLTGDLAAVRAESIDSLISRAPTDRAAFVADHEGIGTSALLVPSSVEATPRFGVESAQAHRSIGAQEMTDGAPADIRLDIDTMSDLNLAIDLGVGAHTQMALARLAATK